MGGHMVRHLNHQYPGVTVFSRSAERRAELAADGLSVSESVEDLAELSDVLFLCLTDSEAVKEVSAKIATAQNPPRIVVDHSTIHPETAKEVAEQLAQAGTALLDAPVTGGSMGAKAGKLICFVGGSEDVLTEVTPLLSSYCKTVAFIGAPGSGQTMKMANQIAVAGSVLGLCECLAFASRSGLSLQQTVELISQGAGGSWSFDNYGPKILAGDHQPGFSIENQLKDLLYAVDVAEGNDLRLHTAELMRKHLEAMVEAGRGDLATTAIYESLVNGSLEGEG
jgi:3-hydroxyisobutyrate dehydrogenase-like beta-hydroxyacid dehydrogenase